jgi:enoyl-CoA hydratase
MGKVVLESQDKVAIITLDNPPVRNALTTEMAAELMEICDAIDGNRDIGATVIRGSEGTFCSGSDTRTWSSDLLSDEAFAQSSTVYESFQRFGRLQTPTIAAVRGHSVGAGLNLLLAADLRIVAADAKLTAGFMRIGLHPGGGFFTLLGRTTTRNSTAAVGLFGEAMSGTDAARIGLAWEALPDDEVEPRAIELAGRAARDPLVARHAAASMRRELGPPAIPWEVAAEAERGLQLWTARRIADARG